jgi:hypothetical protein
MVATQKACDEPSPERHKDRNPVCGRRQEDRAEERESGDDHHAACKRKRRDDDAIRRPAPDPVGDQQTAGVHEAHVEGAHSARSKEPREEEGGPSDRADDEWLEQASLCVAPHDAERQEDREDGAEEERAEHREPEERRARERGRVETAQASAGKIFHVVEGLAGAQAIEGEERDREEDDDQEDPTPEALAQRVADDGCDGAHPPAPSIASMYVSSSDAVTTRTP